MIRSATKNDLDGVYTLIRQLSRHKFTNEQFEDCYLYTLENDHILVYEQDENIYGCGILSINYPLDVSRRVAEIVELIVDENVRSRGIGKKLIKALEQIAIDNSCVCITLGSGKPREAAHRFYKREGFADTHYKFTKELYVEVD